jgi:hypothetical protein
LTPFGKIPQKFSLRTAEDPPRQELPDNRRNEKNFRFHYERVMFCIKSVTPGAAEQLFRKRRLRPSRTKPVFLTRRHPSGDVSDAARDFLAGGFIGVNDPICILAAPVDGAGTVFRTSGIAFTSGVIATDPRVRQTSLEKPWDSVALSQRQLARARNTFGHASE